MRGWATGPSWKGLMCKYQNISGWWWVGQAGGVRESLLTFGCTQLAGVAPHFTL